MLIYQSSKTPFKEIMLFDRQRARQYTDYPAAATFSANDGQTLQDYAWKQKLLCMEICEELRYNFDAGSEQQIESCGGNDNDQY